MCPLNYECVKVINLWSEDQLVPGLEVPNECPDNHHTTNRMQLSIDEFNEVFISYIFIILS